MSEGILFSRLLVNLIDGTCIKNVGKGCKAKNYHPVSLLSVVDKVFENAVIDRLVNHPETGLLGLINQQQIF